MGWCYTFGVEGDSACKHPMLVRNSLDACDCSECGHSCGGKFPGCWSLVFAAGGRELQLRSLPPAIPSGPESPGRTGRPAAEDGSAQVGPALGGPPSSREGRAAVDMAEQNTIAEELGVLRSEIDRLVSLLRESQSAAGVQSTAIAQQDSAASELAAFIARQVELVGRELSEKIEGLEEKVARIAARLEQASHGQTGFGQPGPAVAHPESIPAGRPVARVVRPRTALGADAGHGGETSQAAG